jgi:hypothetical protein
LAHRASIDRSVPGEESLMATRAEYDETIRSAMVELTTALATNTDQETTLGRVTAAAVTLMDGVDYADVN